MCVARRPEHNRGACVWRHVEKESERERKRERRERERDGKRERQREDGEGKMIKERQLVLHSVAIYFGNRKMFLSCQ